MSALKSMMTSHTRAIKVAEQMCRDIGLPERGLHCKIIRTDPNTGRQGWDIAITKPDGTTVGRFVPDHEEKKG